MGGARYLPGGEWGIRGHPCELFPVISPLEKSLGNLYLFFVLVLSVCLGVGNLCVVRLCRFLFPLKVCTYVLLALSVVFTVTVVLKQVPAQAPGASGGGGQMGFCFP